MKPAGGTYVVWLRLVRETEISVGRLGNIHFPKGHFAYVGSAFGPGGLPARVGRHLAGTGRPRWHIDDLRRRAAPVLAWVAARPERREHDWAAVLAALPGATLPVPGFGSSDCRCPAHLVHFRRRPGLKVFRAALNERFPGSAMPRRFSWDGGNKPSGGGRTTDSR